MWLSNAYHADTAQELQLTLTSNIKMSSQWLLIPVGIFTHSSFTGLHSCETRELKTSREQRFCVLFEENDYILEWFEEDDGKSLFTTTVSRKASQDAQHVQPWGRWATTAQNHTTGFHFCQPRRRNWTVEDWQKTEQRLLPDCTWRADWIIAWMCRITGVTNKVIYT